MYVSTRDGKRFEKSFPDRVEKDEGMNRVQTYSTIQLNPEKVKQEIFGFGGAFTDAAAIQWMSARKTDRRLAKKLTKAYFSSGGLQYNMGRVPIASCDFSTRVYSYDDAPDDFQMTNFSLAKEDEFKRRFIKAAIEEIEKSTQKKAGLHQNVKGNDNSLWLFGSPWSAPAWMKQTKKMSGGGHLINSTQYWQAYALYFYKFFTTFDVPWWGMTIENEPDIATLDWSWQALQFSAEEMRDFLKNYLGPTLKKLPFDLKIMILDGGMSSLPSWADTIYNDPVATKFTSGAAIHWYGYTHACAKYLNDTNHNHPDKFILATEACAGWAEGDRGVKLGSWERAEDYADNIIMDLKNYVRGWVDWNLILDTNGGPNWAKNFVDAPILYNGTEFYKQSLYYALAHFSKFIPRGSTIIDASVKHPGNDSGLQVLTAMTPSNNLVSVILNKEDYQVTSYLQIGKSLNERYAIKVPPRSIATVVFNPN
ncbi:hypothetical protein WR25_23748 [Diploscapter pachys]|uniref:Glucosylceramidase n=1 Tax=Diploscapter pachys TaxID=2018661 RepID=A0A2A2JFW4_9BILA|nr:hypothetical protein WR25_23748 [Diploscapter pachys]